MSAVAAGLACAAVLLAREAWSRPGTLRLARTTPVASSSGGFVRAAWAALDSALDRMALPVDPAVVKFVVPALALGLPGALLALSGPAPAVAATACLALAGFRAAATGHLRRARASDRALPEALEAVARILRAGGSLAQALSGAQSATPPALARSWARLVGLVSGLGVKDAVLHWAAENDRPPPQLAAAALAIAAETGGSPARAVDGVAATLRAREAVLGELHSLTAQARASAAVIAASPLAFGVLAGLADPRTAAFFRSRAGAAALFAGLTLDAAGAWWMARLCRSPR